MEPRWLDDRRQLLQGGSKATGQVCQIRSNLDPDSLNHSIDQATGFLLERQHADGYWVAELEGDTILESEYILLLTYLNRENDPVVTAAARYIFDQQLPTGGWALYPGGPLEISSSVKAYWALKIAGYDPQSEPLQRARTAILAAGGAEQVNSFTRYYLALLGIIGYHQCPAVPPELMLIPRWAPFNIYEMSAWSRTILVPLTILWSYRPVRQLPPEMGIDELFCGRPQDLPVSMPPSETLDDLSHHRRLDWDRIFRWVDRAIKTAEKLKLHVLRPLAIKRAQNWMVDRFDDSDGLGAIFPPIIWSVVALKCLGYDEAGTEIQQALSELEKLGITEQGVTRLQPCKSPVWDTAIATIALRDAGVPWNHEAIRRSRKWLLSKEVKRRGDWAVRNPETQAAGWFFEFENAFYPDIDDTIMVLMALSRCLPETSAQLPWDASFFVNDWSPHEADRTAAAIVSTRTFQPESTVNQLEDASPMLAAMWRAVRWTLSMQNRDGGWAAFDRDNDRELFTRVPFADHNAMIDPSTADITARVLEMLGTLDVSQHHPAAEQAIRFVWEHQEADHCWYGRWGVNYIYGTWQAICGLTGIGIPKSDQRIQQAAAWLKSCQQADGGWGETPRSYDQPELRGTGPVTASQTAWSLLGLIAAGHAESESVERGVQFLLDTQTADGSWDEPWYTGTGFPKVFYLRYHFYRHYFPLMALGRYRSAVQQP